MYCIIYRVGIVYYNYKKYNNNDTLTNEKIDL